ncbi:MAG TPA: hypothetical protein VEG39_16625 [Clostridia bacterium]|nr:hypothetical protein [Clostridia bacterium]
MISRNIKYIIYSILSFVLFCFGISLQIKALIGQSVLNAFAVTISYIVDLKVGTLLNIINSLFFISYLSIRRSRMNYTDAVQIVATIANGYVINFFMYNLLHSISIENYVYRVMIFLIGLIISSINLGIVLAIGIIKFPLESLCLIISEVYKKKLSVVRRSFDIVLILATLCITVVENTALNIREGTVISFFLLSTILGASYNFFKRQMTRGRGY